MDHHSVMPGRGNHSQHWYGVTRKRARFPVKRTKSRGYWKNYREGVSSWNFFGAKIFLNVGKDENRTEK